MGGYKFPAPKCDPLDASLEDHLVMLHCRSIARLEIDNDELRDQLAASERARAVLSQKASQPAKHIKPEPGPETGSQLGPMSGSHAMRGGQAGETSAGRNEPRSNSQVEQSAASTPPPPASQRSMPDGQQSDLLSSLDCSQTGPFIPSKVTKPSFHTFMGMLISVPGGVPIV